MRELGLAAREHFEYPSHAGRLDPHHPDVAVARVGAPVSGEILQLHLRVDEQGVISAVRFKAYGCGWMIACSSLLAKQILGQTLAEAAQFRHHELVERLIIPPEKLHCAVLVETGLKAALRNSAAKQNLTISPTSS